MSFEQRSYSRRDILYATAVGLGLIPRIARAESCERDRPPDRDFLIIDWAPNYCVSGLAQDYEANNFDFVSELTRNTFLPSPLIDPAEKFYDLTDPFRSFGKAARETVTDHIPVLNPVATRLDDAQGHGKFVYEVMTNVLRSFGHDVKPVLYPIQNDLYQEVGRTQDELGNPIVYMRMRPEKFREALDRNPLARVVNFSWQFGDIGLKLITKTQDENGNTHISVPRIEIQGAYREEAAEENLTAFIDICNDYPDITFLGAAGNNHDYPKEVIARKKAEGKWAKNFILVGEAFPEEWEIVNNTIINPRLNAVGAELYLPSHNPIYNLRDNDGSTYATAMATGIAGHLYRSGMTSPAEIKAALLEMSEMFYVDFTQTPEDNFDMHYLELSA